MSDSRPGPHHRARLRVAGLAAATALVGGAIGITGGLLIAGAPGACDTRRVAADTLPAVVTVAVNGPRGSGSGSGAIIGPDGLIVTNDHVVASAVRSGRIEVLLTDGDRERATLVGTDPKTDLAVLRIDRTDLPALALAPRDPLSVGQPVVALGAPLGLSGTVTSGIVSAVNRNVPVPTADGGTTVLLGAIQTDASINPGNSGGPLVSCRGRLVGVNTAISTVPGEDGTGGGGSVGIGFAVPASTTQRIVDQIVADGRADHPWIGATLVEVSGEAASTLGSRPGLIVQDVSSGGPAAAAGLEAGDLITRIGDERANSITLSLLLLTAQVGDQVPVEYLRDGVRSSTALTLAEQPS